jgi:hypothetical protein
MAAALLIIVLSLVLIGILTALSTGLPRSFHKHRQTTRNAERQALAASQGWYFSPYAPALVTRWYAAPFVQRGDRRLVYGVVSGTYNGVRFTVFDFQLRTHISVVNGVQSEDNSVYTVWVIHLPTTLPYLTVVRRGIFGRQYAGEVPWLDPEFSRQFAVYCLNPGFAAALLTPSAMQMIAWHAREGVTVQGADLIYASANKLAGQTAVELMRTVDMLRALVAAFPPHVWWQRQN